MENLEGKLSARIKALFPLYSNENQLPIFLKELLAVLDKKIKHKDIARIPGKCDKNEFMRLVEKYSFIPLECENSLEKCVELVSDLFSSIPRWRSPQLQYNVGAPVNTAAVALYALAMDENIYSINDGHAGTALTAEQAVSKILANLAGIETPAQGLFTFGGTATNFYAVRVGIRKAAPDSGKKGLPKNLKMMITQDAHFTHALAASWLGLGTDNVVVIDPNPDRSSNFVVAERKMREIFDHGNLLTTIMLNGGTFYGQVIDDIGSFAKLRYKIVDEYNLPYKPHIHVDSVHGWEWLVFKDYDFDKNELEISPPVIQKIKNQYNKIAQVKYADSWGVDFHKAIGACPVPSSLIMFNDINDLNFLSKTEGQLIDLHTVAKEFSFTSPSDFTLETSRPCGAALSALASLHTLGLQGLRRNLANLLEQSYLTRSLLECYDDVSVYNKEQLGFVTMVRLYPHELKNDPLRDADFIGGTEEARAFICQVNKYMKDFFMWDLKNRIKENIGVEYSFSTGFVSLPDGTKLCGLKLYPVSPHFNEKYARDAVETIMTQKALYDNSIHSGSGI